MTTKERTEYELWLDEIDRQVQERIDQDSAGLIQQEHRAAENAARCQFPERP